MAVTVIESLSSRKLIGVLSLFLVIQALSFYIGAFVTPSPSSLETFISNHCTRRDRGQLAIPRHSKSLDQDIAKNCDRPGASPISGARDKFTTTFAVQLPLPRDSTNLAYSRWMQTLLVILTPRFRYEPLLAAHHHQQQQSSNKYLDSNSPSPLEGDFQLVFDVTLAVKDRDDTDWKIYFKRTGLEKTIKCSTPDVKLHQDMECDMIQLFELQSLYYDYYLINFEINEDERVNSSSRLPATIKEISGVAIHQNGGFMQIWLLMKTIYLIITTSTLVWFCRRLMQLNRKTTLLERILIGLGLAITQFNAPVELISLHIEVPFMAFLNDLRQGIFYCALLSFWIIFVGEHLLDGARHNSSLANYTKELFAILVASVSLLILDLYERGIRTFDPFLTIWESEPNLANFSIVVACGAFITYLGFLVYYIYLAYSTISGKRTSLPEMPLTKRLKYQGMIYRFKFLLCATVVCALSTFIFYRLSQKTDWSYEEDATGSFLPYVEWTSAMLISVCAMWNLYVIVLMILYAPSHKGMSADEDQIEFDCLTDDKEDELYGRAQ